MMMVEVGAPPAPLAALINCTDAVEPMDEQHEHHHNEGMDDDDEEDLLLDDEVFHLSDT